MADTTLVGTGKPKVAGGIYVAPAGTTLPTDATTALADTFKSLGYISEDGVENDNSPETDQVKEWGGGVIADIQSDRPDTFKYKMCEVANTDVLKEIYGDKNVTVDESGNITISATSDELSEKVYVIEMIQGKYYKRIVIPLGQVSEIGTISYKGTELVGYETTVSAHSYYDSTAKTSFSHKEYMSKISTT